MKPRTLDRWEARSILYAIIDSSASDCKTKDFEELFERILKTNNRVEIVEFHEANKENNWAFVTLKEK